MDRPSLFIFSGLPGTGKSSIARALAAESGGLWLRIDSIEQAIKMSDGSCQSVNDAGYVVAHAVARDNLGVGRTVIADCVNPWMLTRDAWRDVGKNAGARIVEIEIVCSDTSAHRRRVETRVSDVPGLVLPLWEKILSLDFHIWERDHLVIDTASMSVEQCTALILAPP